MSSHTDNKLVSNDDNHVVNELNCDESESNSSCSSVDTITLMNERKNNCVASVSGSVVCQNGVAATDDEIKEIKHSPPQSPPLMLNNSLTNPPSASSFDTTMGGLSQSLNLFQNYSGVNNASHHHHHHHHSNQKSSPFLLPAQFYKNLFASAAMLQNSKPDKGTGSAQTTPFPRNLLFSCAQKSPGMGSTSDLENEDKSNVLEQKSYAWTGSEQGQLNNNNNNTSTNNNNNAEATQSNANPSNNNAASTASSSTTTSSSGMPVPGGVQGQNPTQGLVHWMSAVMAEHMTSNSHHDPAVGMHYMWNGAVDQCGQHKDIDSYNGWPAPRNPMSMKQGYEAKMSSIDHHNNMQKGLIDDGHHLGQSQMPSASIYGANALRSVSSSSNSPGGHLHHPHGGTSALLVVPQPINASKMPNGMPNGTGRKYQCKMCPQIFTSKADLQLHTQVHMREAKPYKCSQCSKAFANSSYLSQHTRIHLGIKPYRCEICQRKFTQLSHLQQHIRTHTGDKPYKCRHPGCQKAFSQLSNLQSHSRCHQTDKPYKCNSCYKCFSDEPSLLEHIPKHKESKHLKTHICQYCGKSYTQETYLTKHMQKHAERTDKRPPISSLPAAPSTKNLTLNTPAIPPMTGDHPYWPKVSPDSAANLTEIIQHQQPQQSHEFTSLQQNGHSDMQQQQQQQQQHHRNSNSTQNSMVETHHREDVEDLAMSRQNSNNGHMNGNNGQIPPSSTPMSINYDSASKTTSNSAFTPINSMPPHLNSLGHHHQLAQRPYLYDAISFPNKNVAQNTGNSFPNQLISLHQIRNYAHQPSGLMTGEHLLSGVTVGPGKDKG